MCDLSKDVTHHGLEKWFTHIFEKLGWMVLAYEKRAEPHYHGKVKQYFAELDNFIAKAQNKADASCTVDADRRSDLNAMLTHANKLKMWLNVTMPNARDSKYGDLSGSTLRVAEQARNTRRAEKARLEQARRALVEDTDLAQSIREEQARFEQANRKPEPEPPFMGGAKKRRGSKKGSKSRK